MSMKTFGGGVSHCLAPRLSTVNSAVILQPCNTDDNEIFEANVDGYLFNPASGRCLKGNSQNEIKTNSCEGGDAEKKLFYLTMDDALAQFNPSGVEFVTPIDPVSGSADEPGPIRLRARDYEDISQSWSLVYTETQ